MAENVKIINDRSILERAGASHHQRLTISCKTRPWPHQYREGGDNIVLNASRRKEGRKGLLLIVNGKMPPPINEKINSLVSQLFPRSM